MSIKNQSFLTFSILLLLLSIFHQPQLATSLPPPLPTSFLPPPLSTSFLPPLLSTPTTTNIPGGAWLLLQESIGISAMHMQLLKNNKVVIFDRTDFGRSNISLPLGARCRFNDEAIKPIDCTAHSVLYDISSNTIHPLTVRSNTFCSSGSLDPNGTLIQTGGDRRGERVIRTFTPCECPTCCDWVELPTLLFNRRWYASNQILPDGRIIIVGGRRSYTYEFYPKINSLTRDNFTLPFLIQTRDPQEENNLYPFLHLLPSGNLFIFANNRSILFDYTRNQVVQEYPIMPGGVSRNYPSTGSSVLLPLRSTGENNNMPAEVMICGGSPPGAYLKSTFMKIYVEASRTCGRLKVSDPEPEWVMELMPFPRVMNDMVLLPTGDVIILNGAANGSAGWDAAINPVYNPVIYFPDEDPTRRFAVLNPTEIARLYHATAALMPDGSILVGGSNPYRTYNFTARPYPTELSLEAFYPHYLDPQYTHMRPSILTVESMDISASYNEIFGVTFVCYAYRPELGVSVVILPPSFTTHSFGMNQRMVELSVEGGVTQLSTYAYRVSVIGPRDVNVAPPGYYMMFVVHAGIPSHAVWVLVR